MWAVDRAVYAAWTPDGGWGAGWKGVSLWSMSVVLAWQQDKALLTVSVPGLLQAEPPPLPPCTGRRRAFTRTKHNGSLFQSCMSVFLKSYFSFDSTIINELFTRLLCFSVALTCPGNCKSGFDKITREVYKTWRKLSLSTPVYLNSTYTAFMWPPPSEIYDIKSTVSIDRNSGCTWIGLLTCSNA